MKRKVPLLLRLSLHLEEKIRGADREKAARRPRPFRYISSTESSSHQRALSLLLSRLAAARRAFRSRLP